MMRTGTKHAEAVTFLRRVVESHRERVPDERLPTLRQLSQRCALSIFTLSSAMAQLEREGLVVVRKQRGTWIAGAEPSPASVPVVVGPKWVRLRGLIERDIYRGTFRPGAPLPGPRELARAHGVSRETVRKALESLASRGILVADAGGFRTPLDSLPAGGGAVVFVTFGTGHGTPKFINERDAEFYRLLENHCLRSGLRLMNLFYTEEDKGRATVDRIVRELRALLDNSTVVGFVVLGSLIDQVPRLVRLFTEANRPVAVIDEWGNFPERFLVTRNANVRVLPMSSTMYPGELAGRHLIKLGHRHIAWFTVWRTYEWSRMRAAGLERAVKAAGPDHSLTEYAVDIEEHMPVSLEGESLVDRIAQAYRARASHTTSSTLPSRLRRAMGAVAFDECRRSVLEPLMQQALADGRITAWVFCNDKTALVGLDFLAAKAIAVPRRMSVMGFDNLPLSQGRNLTSYDFNMGGLVDAAMARMLGAVRSSTPPPEPVEIRGMIVPRGATGPAPRRRPTG